MEDLVRSAKSNKFRPFIPDFSVRVSEDVQILRIRRVHWLAAVRATYFEHRQTANGETPMLNSDGEQIDLLTQELEGVDNGEQGNVVSNIGGTGSDTNIGQGTPQDRTSSTSPTTASDSAMENERFLPPHASLINPSNAAKTSVDSPTSSGRNTPTSSAMQKRSMFRPDGSIPPPSLTAGTSSSSKNRSLT